MAKKSASTPTKKVIKVRQVRSIIGCPEPMRESVRGLGLRRIGHVVEVEDTPSVRGMVFKVKHLVQIVEGDGR
ncbi:MAG TPA: 50S ribosomal protein L30 [Thermoanaerobaculia bacterium]|nr:50S ribosomal protein L30 [Thermoanaerobaculia bacterium]HUM30656.1 50S ribosomal protein L30 [Thermoanaerobaculia bacterium]HXK68936.1 50S ribosomal protein L30 [Thermoanaerobaculia bacterium]